MIRVMIAEDEEPDLRSLIKCIDWDASGLELVTTAREGDEALEKIYEYLPDILLTDIEMPGKNGVDIVKEISEKLPSTKVIFLSGHQDFNYAQAGLECKVVHYLLKPYDVQRLNSLLNKLAMECVAEKNRRLEENIFKQQLLESIPLIKNKFYMDIISSTLIDSGVIKEKAAFLDIQLPQKDSIVMVIELDDYKSIEKELEERERQLLVLKIMHSIDEVVGEITNLRFSVSEYKFAVIMELCHKSEDYKAWMEAIADRLKRYININVNQSVTIGVGGYAKQLTDIAGVYKRAEEALNNKFFSGKNQVIFYEDLLDQQNENTMPDTKKLQEDIINCIRIGNSDEVAINLDGIFNLLQGNNKVSDIYIRSICFQLATSASLVLLEMNESLNNIFGDETMIFQKLLKFDTILDIHLWMKQVFVFICQYISKSKLNRNSRIIESIKNIIHDKFASDITIEQIAREVYLSAGYALNIFKKETGETIIQYIIKVRMRRAMELLKNENARISEVAEQIGYSNITYFSSAFKNFTGMSPREYRENILK